MEVSKLGFIIWTREAIGGSKVIYRIVYTTLLIARTHTHTLFCGPHRKTYSTFAPELKYDSYQ